LLWKKNRRKKKSAEKGSGEATEDGQKTRLKKNPNEKKKKKKNHGKRNPRRRDLHALSRGDLKESKKIKTEGTGRVSAGPNGKTPRGGVEARKPRTECSRGGGALKLGSDCSDEKSLKGGS